MGERWWARLVTLGTVGTVLMPIRQFRRAEQERVDSFPLSYYPMFSQRLGQYWHLRYAVGVRADGSRTNLPYRVLGTGGVNQVRKQLFRAVDRGRAGEHAAYLARRVAADPGLADVTRVEIVRAQFDLDDCMLNRNVRVHGEEIVLGAAQVPPGSLPTAGAPNLPRVSAQ